MRPRGAAPRFARSLSVSAPAWVTAHRLFPEEPDAPACAGQLQHSGDHSVREQQDGAQRNPGPAIAPCFPGILAAPLAVAPASVTAAWSGRAGRARRASAARRSRAALRSRSSCRALASSYRRYTASSLHDLRVTGCRTGGRFQLHRDQAPGSSGRPVVCTPRPRRIGDLCGVVGLKSRQLVTLRGSLSCRLLAHSRTLWRAASRMSCAWMLTRVSPIPNAGHWQKNSSGPGGGRGHAHHRKSMSATTATRRPATAHHAPRRDNEQTARRPW
jgi:hypothetical protein